MKRVLVISLFLLVHQVFPQTNSKMSLSEIINYFIGLTTEEEETSELFDYYENLHENPININKANYIDLSQLPVLDYSTIPLIIDYRRRHKKFASLTELYNCGLRKSVVDMIIPFLTLNDKSENSKMNNHSINTRSFVTRNFKNDLQPEYFGNPYRINNRIKANYNDKYYLSILTDKDPGEKSIADFYNFSFLFKGKSIIKKVLIGNYTMEFGQGLAIWSPYSFSKSGDAIGSVVKNPRFATPYSSSGENRFLFGGAVQLQWEKLKILPFYSSEKVSALIDSIGFRGLNNSGLFRSSQEIEKRENLKITTLGIIIGYKNAEDNFSANLLYLQNNFSLPFYNKIVRSSLVNKQLSFSGSLKFKIKRLLISSEVSNTNGITAQFYSARFFISRNINFISAFRYYPHNYFALFSNGFGEKKTTNNESGFYNGIRISTKLGKVNFYYDFNNTVFLTSTEPFPVKRNDYLLDYYSPSLFGLKCRVRYHREKKEHYETLSSTISKSLTEELSERMRLTIYLSLGKELKLKSQGDITRFRSFEKEETGFALTENIRFVPSENLTIYAQAIFFDIPTYDSRVYIYENDLDGIFRMGMYYGKGTSEFIMAKLRLFGYISLTVKYSELRKLDWEINPGNYNLPRPFVERRIAIELQTKFNN